ncbi:dihydroxyacetone kinase transcriptional activator DhaS [Latilactobacillus graminis]|uniref:Bacterial regulatory s, tetR family protein n=2 Tax=Latilactobacillus graminis TaxID=60519 RepID=A0AA89I2W0_9LACO|nr:dihydroxyacetone kinase transcriptional activator DhaS [Latilactobacillus graminis]KRM24503.1 bacterial regulatory s, tetR family protein [Latilactobacillus graminis DSM 20719]QFP79041.1 dihydroxyacetone kinase transcriptional activator DhaS [Latilactobacillus graminis]
MIPTTQQKIVTVFKQLMIEQPFNKISVTAIMHQAGIRRQTFYDYFSDKYALLDWIYEQEIGVYIDDNLNYIHWTQVLVQLFNYFDANRDFYQNALSIKGQNAFELHFIHHVHQLINRIIQDLADAHHITLSTDYRAFLLNFLSNALVAYTADWLRSRHPQPVSKIITALKMTLTDSINGLLLRTGHLYEQR